MADSCNGIVRCLDVGSAGTVFNFVWMSAMIDLCGTVRVHGSVYLLDQRSLVLCYSDGI